MFNVPTGVSWIQVDASGAAGSDQANTGFLGGKGGRIQATVSVTAGERLYLYAGGTGGSGGTTNQYVAGWNGGGAGFTHVNADGGGGGATDIRRNSFTVTAASLTSNSVTLTTSAAHGIAVGAQVIVSGVGAPYDGTFTTTTGTAGSTIRYAVTNSNIASATVNGTVRGPSLWSTAASLTSRILVAGGGGGAGYQVNGGAGGGLAGGNSVYGGATAVGGNQVTGNALGVGQTGYGSYSGGGGGGYWGGGASNTHTGGGGGSSWTASDAAAVVHTQGSQSGNGAITIRYSVDSAVPQVSTVTSTTASGVYRLGDVIPIYVNFSESVVVTGTPRLSINAGTRTAVLTYAGGSGTSSLRFDYAVAAGDLTSALDYDSTTAFSLNGGTIADRAGNAADVTLAAPGAPASLAGDKTLVIDADPPAAPTLLAADGTDSILLDWSDNSESDLKEYRVYSCSSLVTTSCSATSSFSILSSVQAPTSLFDHIAVGRGITYYYYVVAVDTRGNESAPSSIVSWTLPAPALVTTPSVITDNPTSDTTPTITGTADVGAIITFEIDGVIVSPTATVANDGSYTYSPTAALSQGTHTIRARAAKTVSNKTNSSGWSLGWTVTIDTTAPRLSSVARFAPATATTSADSVVFAVGFDSVVTGVSAADFVASGTTATVTDVSARAGVAGGYLVTLSGGDLATVNGAVGLAIDPAASITDLAGNALTNLTAVTTTETYTMDNNFPSATITTSPTSISGSQTATVTFTLSRASTDFGPSAVTAGSGSLSNFAGSGTTYTATYTPSSGANGAVTFTVAAGSFTDANGLANSASSGSITVDSVAPTFTNITSTKTDGTYKAGEVIDITVTTSEAVTVTGTPTLTLETGTTDRAATYASGSGTTTLTFRYTVQAGDNSGDLDIVSTSALALAGGTLKDAAGNNATQTLMSPGAAGSLGFNNALVIDTTAPDVPTSLVLTPVGGTVVSNTLLAANTNLTATATITTGQATGGTARLYLGTSIIAADTSIASGDTEVTFDLGLSSAAALQAEVAAGGSVTVVLLDAAGNASPASTAVILTADYVAPTMSIATDRTSFVSGDTATLTFTVSEPTTNFTAGDVTVTGGNLANWTAVAGGKVYTATFIPSSGDGIAGSVQVGAGNLTDAAGNPNTSSNTINFTIDTVRPTITAFTSTSANGLYKQGDAINISATASEQVKGGASITVTLDTGASVTLSRVTAGTTLTGTYTVGASQTSNDLTVTSFTIGGVQDSAGNAMTSTAVPGGASNISDAKAIMVDSLAPDAPGAPVLTAVGGTTGPSNTVNGTNTDLTATATIAAGQTVAFGEPSGGSAQLRINGVVIASDSTIWAADTGVNFTMGTATASALQAAIASGGSVTVVLIDAAGNISVPGSATTLMVDYTAPTATITSNASALKFGQTANLTITLSKGATDFVSGDLSISGGTITSFSGSGTSYAAVFTPTADTPSGTATISVPSARFTDASGNSNVAASNTISISVDNVPPTVASAAIASNNGNATMAKAGNTITVTLETSETVTIAGGTPSIPLTLGSSTVNAVYVSGSGTNSLVFRYTVVSGNTDTSGGIGVGVLAANGATMADGAGNALNAAFSAPLNAIVVDTTAPNAPLISGTSPVNVGTATPTISGTAEAGSTVRVYDTSVSPVALLGIVTAGGGGAWSITSTLLADGDHAVSATATDAAGNLSANATSVTWRVDLTAPAAPLLNSITDDTGRSATDRITNDTTITVIGTAEAGSTVQLYSDGSLTGSSVTANASGAWAATTDTLSSGAATLTAKATDAAGNTSDASIDLLATIDTTAPTAPSIAALTTPSANALPTLAGTTTSNEIITIYDGGTTVVGVTVANNAGAWTFTLTSSLLDGSHSFTATGTDVAGNTSVQGAAVAYEVDTTPPAVTLGAIAGNNDITYAEKRDGVTLAGTIENGATVAVKIFGTTADGTVTYPTSTTWAYIIDPTDWTAIGTTSPIPFEITARDALGNATVVSRSVTANVASVAAPGTPDLDASSDSAARDYVTNLSTVTVNVTLVTSGAVRAKVGQVLDLLDGSGYVIATHTLVSGDVNAGTYAFRLAGLADGTYNLAARVTDSGTAVGSSTGSFVVDTRPLDAPGTPDLASGSDSGVSSSDNRTNVSAGTFTVSISSIQISASGLITDDQVRLLVDGVVVDTATLGGSIPGSLTFPSIALSEGTHSISAVAFRSSNGATSPTSSILSVVVDRTGSVATSAPDLLAADDTGSSSTDNITSIPQPRLSVSLSGTGAAAGDQVKILDGATVLGTATVTAADITASFTTVALTTSLAEGVNSLTARLDDRAGNVGTSSLPLSVTLTTVPPNAPTPNLASLSDSATVGDRLTNDTTPTISGTGTNGQVITLYAGGVAIGTATVSGGAWSITPSTPLVAGQRPLTVTATDWAGNMSNPSAPLVVTIDATAPALPVVTGISVDSGSSNSDGITNDSDISISGTAEVGAAITVTWSGGTRSTTADATGAWIIASVGTLSDGSYSFSVTATDQAGNVSSPATKSVTIDTVAPAAPAVTSPSATRTNPPAIGGTGVAGSTVTVYDGPTLLGTAVVSGGGTWTFTPSSALSEGTHAISATQSDAAGNISSSSASFAVTIDTTAPAVPSVDAQVTSSLTPTITGTGVAGSTIKLYRSSQLLNPSTTVTVNVQGVWTYPATFGAAGVQLVAASASDALGNTSTTSSDAAITIDQTAPAAPVISGSPIATNSATPTVTGTAEADATVKLYAASLLIGQTTANGAGAWSIVTSSLGTGTYVITAKATDAAGNTSVSSIAASLIVDVTPPAAPTVNVITVYSLTQSLSGTAEAGATVKVYDGSTLVGTATANSSGNWSLTTSNLGAGAHSLTATATDPAGNTGVASSPARTISATYSTILAAADGTANSQISLTASQFAAEGLTQIDNAAKASLLNTVIDSAVVTSVDTPAELSALAATVAGIMATAAGGTASPALTPAALSALGLTGVTSANLADVLAAIAATSDNGSGVDTFTELSAVVANAVAAAATRDAALAIISAYTGSNTAPTTSTYVDAQVAGVTSGNIASINTLIAAMSSTATDTAAEVQAAVDAYTAVLAAADGLRNNSAQLVASQYAAMGMSSIDTAADLALMNRILDTATIAQVDTATELYALGNVVTGIMTAAAGGTTTLTAADFALIGVTGVTSANLASVLGAIAGTADDGTGVDSLVELQALVDQIVASARAAALAIIIGYNGTNTAPTVNDYLNAGITGVNATNLASVNSVIATTATAAKDSAVEVQLIVNAYSDLLAGADGNAANDNVTLTASQYALLGVTAIDSSVKASLMNDVIDGSARTAVDTKAELVTIASVVNRLFTLAAGGTPVPALTAADFSLLGITGVTADNLTAILAALAATADDGSGIDTFAELQSAVTSAANAASAALNVISGYTGSNSAPTVADYVAAGVTGVEAGNLGAINSVIGPLTAGETDTRSEVQAIVDAYNILLAAADGVAGTGGTLTASQFQILGITSINTTSEALLMSLVADTLTVSQIDTKAELVALASIVDRLMTVAAGGVASPPLTAADFAALGIPGVNAANLAGVLAAISATADNGSGIDTFAKLSSVVSSSAAAQQSQARALIAGYTGANAVPAIDTYALIQVTGVNSGNLATINSAIAPLSSAATDSTVEVQAIVDAYLAVLVAADGNLDNDPAVTQGQFTALGLTTIDNAAKVSLLNQVLDPRPSSAVDTYTELANLASIVARIINAAAGITPVPALTAADFAAIGITGVTAYNVDQIIAAIAATIDNGSAVDTISGLSSVVDTAVAQAKAGAIATIAAYDGSNLAPTIVDFANAAVTGVTFANLGAINSVIAVRLPAVTDSTLEIQAIVDVYAAILTAADGNASATGLSLTATDYALLGLGGIDGAGEVALMNSVLSGRTNSQVDSYDKLAEIARVVTAMMLTAAGGTPAPAITLADLALLGLTGIDATNLNLFLVAVAATASDGSGINTLAKLQSISNQVNADQDSALALIAAYDGTNTAPSLATFFAAGVTRVNALNLAGINSFLATMAPGVTDSLAEVQALVDAYIVLAPGVDGIDNNNVNLTLTQWRALGFVEVATPEDVKALDDLFDTIDWSITVDAGIATASGQAALAALRVESRSGEEPAPGPITRPSATPTPTVTATPAPRPTVVPTPSITRKPKPRPAPTATPVYTDAPQPGVGIVEVSPGQVAAVVDGNERKATIEVVGASTVRVTLPNRVIVNLSSILSDGKPAKVASDGALLVVQGNSVDVAGSGYTPGSLLDLTIYSTPTHLGTVTVDADGSFKANFPIPAGIEPGDHSIKIDGTSKAGELTTVSIGVRVLPKAQEPSVETVKPSPTATNSAGVTDDPGLINATKAIVLGVFLLLLILGFFLIAARRRRSASS